MALCCLVAGWAAHGREAIPAVDASLTVSAVSDYRYRGVSLSEGQPAIQAQLTLSHGSGLYVSGWVSSIADNGGDGIETQVAVGYGATAGRVTVDAWAAYYLYPGAGEDRYGEVSARFARRLGAGSFGLLASYAPAQRNIGGTDNLYLGVEGNVGLPGTPVKLVASAGWENGAFGKGKRDWALGAKARLSGFDCAVSYVGAARTLGDVNADDTMLISVSRTF